MYTKEILQLVSLPIMIYVSYRIAFWLYIKIEKQDKLK